MPVWIFLCPLKRNSDDWGRGCCCICRHQKYCTKSLPWRLLSRQLQYDIWMDQPIMSSEQKLPSNVTETRARQFWAPAKNVTFYAGCREKLQYLASWYRRGLIFPNPHRLSSCSSWWRASCWSCLGGARQPAELMLEAGSTLFIKTWFLFWMVCYPRVAGKQALVLMPKVEFVSLRTSKDTTPARQGQRIPPTPWRE